MHLINTLKSMKQCQPQLFCAHVFSIPKSLLMPFGTILTGNETFDLIWTQAHKVTFFSNE